MEREREAQLMTADEVAEVFKLKVQTVRDAAARGRIPVVRLWHGSRRPLLRFQREDIEAFIQSRRIPAESDPRDK